MHGKQRTSRLLGFCCALLLSGCVTAQKTNLSSARTNGGAYENDSQETVNLEKFRFGDWRGGALEVGPASRRTISCHIAIQSDKGAILYFTYSSKETLRIMTSWENYGLVEGQYYPFRFIINSDRPPAMNARAYSNNGVSHPFLGQSFYKREDLYKAYKISIELNSLSMQWDVSQLKNVLDRLDLCHSKWIAGTSTTLNSGAQESETKSVRSNDANPFVSGSSPSTKPARDDNPFK